MLLLKKRRGVRRVVLFAIISLSFYFVLYPDAAKHFWRSTTVFIGVFSVEAAMVYLRKFIGASSEAALWLGLVWVNIAWIWWTFLFTGIRSFSGYAQRTTSRNTWVRRGRVLVKMLINYASEKSQSKHAFIRGMKRLVGACHKNKFLLVLLYIFAGIIPHVDIAAIFIAVTFRFPIIISVDVHRTTIFRLPYLVLWTVFAMNMKILCIVFVLH